MNYHSTIFSKYLGDAELLELISDQALINKVILFELTLTRSLDSQGMIPRKAAKEIVSHLKKVKINPKQLTNGTLQNGVPVLPIIQHLKEGLSESTKPYLHQGATSQDAMDTAFVLMMRDVIAVIEKRIQRLIRQLSQLSSRYGHVPCMAHTRWQQALPVTFDTKVGAWLNPLDRQIERLEELKKRMLVIQLGGAVGNLSAYGKKGVRLRDSMAKELKLQSAEAWHSQRDRFSEFSNWLAMLSASLGKFGADILILSQNEIGEVIENGERGGKSSAMPHKNNPVLSEAMVALARVNAALQATQLESMIHVSERDATAWIIEWTTIPQMIINTGVALNHALVISKKMRIDSGRMKKNIALFNMNKPA